MTVPIRKRFEGVILEAHKNEDALAHGMLAYFLRVIEGKYGTAISLSGGSTPNRFYELLVDHVDEIVERGVHFFWGDERALMDHPESNYAQAYKLFLGTIVEAHPEFEANIHRIRLELPTLEEAVADYSAQTEQFADGFDLSITGMGTDGHRNGVMPDHPEISWVNRIWEAPRSWRVFGYEVPEEVNSFTNRVTLTPWFLNRSKVSILLVAGKSKAKVIEEVILGDRPPQEFPAGTMTDRGETLDPLVILTDEAGAERLLVS